jgi:hypothetical protein
MKICQTFPLAALTLAAMLIGLSPTTACAQQGAGTLPSSETVRSLLMNNWSNLLAIHYARQLTKDDPRLFGPYLSGLHSAIDWPVNQIDGATAFFRASANGGSADNGPERSPSLCEFSGDVKGDSAAADPGVRQSYPSAMCFDDGGVLNVEYLRETERALPIQIEKSYAMAPFRDFLIVRYTVINNVPAADQKSVHVRIAEVVDLNNKAALDHEESQEDLVDTGINEPVPGEQVKFMGAQWHPELNAWIADMTAPNGTFLVFGALQDMDRHRVFEPASDEIAFDEAIAPEMDVFDQEDLPQSLESDTARDLGLSLWKEDDIAPGGRMHYSFFYGVAGSMAEAQQIAQQARGPQMTDAWFEETGRLYAQWLQMGRQFDVPDPALQKAYRRVLVTNKQAQQPQFGSFVAATNPGYGFKVWPRDSSVTALGFAAAGHLDEAVKFYRWLAAVQEDGHDDQHPQGTWFTNYGYWTLKRPKTFVEPEWDSLGLFMIGVYHTWRLLGEVDPQAARKFLTDPLDGVPESPGSVYEAVHRAAEYIRTHINEHNYGPGDFSIWEEDFKWNTFTQVTYASGLNAASRLAEALGDTEAVNGWLNGASRVLEAIHRPASTEDCPGLWNDGESRWNRSTSTDCKRDDRLDASTDIAWVFGLVHADDSKVITQRDAVLSRLTPGEGDFGIARYEGYEFYHNNPASPGGTGEASAATPSWPQMDMYMDMLEHWRALDDVALQRLQWYASVTNVGYMPPGEAVDWQTKQPLPSTASEPVTGAWYVMALLNYLNLFDPRLPPLEQEPRRLPPPPRPIPMPPPPLPRLPSEPAAAP